MNHPTREFRLGVIGGCLTHQPGIPLSQLFHRRIARMLRDDTGTHLDVSVAREFQADYVTRIAELTGRTAVDGILLNVRNIFYRKAGVVSAYRVDGSNRFVLHPFLFRRQRIGPTYAELESKQFGAAAAPLQRDDPPLTTNDARLPGLRIAGFRVRELNYVFGALVGLDRWAVRDELALVDLAVRDCKQRGIPLLVMGPTPIKESHMKNRLCRMMNHSLKGELQTEGVPFYSPQPLEQGPTESTHVRDGWHLNAEGHRLLAESLYPLMTRWIDTIKIGS